MKLYDVELTYQNFGSAWLGVLRGKTEDIELAFNGLFNFCATNGELSYQDHAKCVATFWSNRKAMRRFFFNRHYIPRFEDRHHPANSKLIREAMRYAHTQLDLLTTVCHESFMDFDRQWQFSGEAFACGKIVAERPDENIKDVLLTEAFVRSGNEVVDKG